MNVYDHDIHLTPETDGAFAGHVHPGWNIGANPNGGYLASLIGAGIRRALPAHPDPLSLTLHYLQPGLADRPCRVEPRVLRSGRQLSSVRATLLQEGTARVEAIAAFGDLGAGGDATLDVPPPDDIPPPDRCVLRDGGEQGVALPILERLDIRLHPGEARAGHAGRSQVTGWIRFADGREPDTLACVLFADAFPPAVFGLLGPVGWVPTVELTVHVRRRPAPGWMLARFRTVDLSDGRLIEDGMLWDAQGRLVVQSRQLALVRSPSRPG